MRTRLGWIVGLAVVVFIGASFALAHAQAKPIKIGQIIPITGEAAESGKYHKQGAEIAVDKINAAGGINGRKIQIVLEDDQTTNPGAVAALQKLLEDKEIPMILGSIRSTQVQAMLPTINEAKIPVAIGGTNYGLTHSGSQWVFRFRPHDGMSAKVIAKFMVEELKQKKVGIVHASDAFGNGGRDMLVPAVKALGGEVVFVQGYNNQEKDFTAVVQGLKKSGATGLDTYMTFSTDLGDLRPPTQAAGRPGEVGRFSFDHRHRRPEPGGRRTLWDLRGRGLPHRCQPRPPRLSPRPTRRSTTRNPTSTPPGATMQ